MPKRHRHRDKKLLEKYQYKKGTIYVAWPKRDPVRPGGAIGFCLASKRSPNGRFDNREALRPGTLVMHVKRAKHGFLRVLHGNNILQIHQNFVWGTPEEFEAAWKKGVKELKRQSVASSE